jgi:hypothetical protein
MSELDFEFEHQGRTVRPGQVLHVAPHMWWRAGPSGRVERYYGDSVCLRADNGAVPTVPIDCLSWEPHPTTVALEQLRGAGFPNPTTRDVAVWQAARRAAMPNVGVEPHSAAERT